VFNDFTTTKSKEVTPFVVNDIDGEELQEVVIEEI
jgi:hypothetical protein